MKVSHLALLTGGGLMLIASACRADSGAMPPTLAETPDADQALSRSGATPTPPRPASPTWSVSTRAPTVTLSPVLTPTAAASTPDPTLGLGDVVYEDPLDGSSEWEWRSETAGAIFSIASGQLNAVIPQRDAGPQAALGPVVAVGDQQVRVTARAHLCYERDEYGLMFHASRTASGRYNAYLFKLTCGGLARVERLLNSQTADVLADWTPSPAIVPRAPAENTLMVWMAEGQFHFYVNDKYVFSALDRSYAEGTYGFYVRDRTAGGMSLSFLNLVARAVTPP